MLQTSEGFKATLLSASEYRTVRQYCIGIMKNWAFLAKTITLKLASISLYDSLAALVRHSQAQNVFRPTPESLYGIFCKKNSIQQNFTLTD